MIHHRPGIAALIVLIPLFLLTAGCFGPPPPSETVPVSGSVSFAGEPLTSGMVSFIAVAGDGGSSRPASAPIQGDGTYKASTFKAGDGMIPGQYKIVVTSEEQLTVEVRAAGKKPVSLIPKQYTSADQTPLTLDVESGTAPVIHNIELTK